LTPSWREQYDRMRRWYARLTEFVSVDDHRVDDFYAFFVCCFHLKDWLKQDSAIDKRIGTDAEALVNSVLSLRLCADVTNGFKHLKRNKPPQIDAEARVEKTTLTFDTAGFSPEAFLSQDFIIVPADGTAWIALKIAENAVAAWDSFLLARGLLPRTYR
jgi:hypothetical protein